jgi:hypothetical protein
MRKKYMDATSSENFGRIGQSSLGTGRSLSQLPVQHNKTPTGFDNELGDVGSKFYDNANRSKVRVSIINKLVFDDRLKSRVTTKGERIYDFLYEKVFNRNAHNE